VQWRNEFVKLMHFASDFAFPEPAILIPVRSLLTVKFDRMPKKNGIFASVTASSSKYEGSWQNFYSLFKQGVPCFFGK